MAKMNGMNKNYVEVYAVLKDMAEGTGFAYDVLAKMTGRTFNSVNATLAAMATKGYVTKAKGVYNETKMLTKYTVTDAGNTAYAEATATVEATEGE